MNETPKESADRTPEHFGYPIWFLLFLIGLSLIVSLLVFSFHLFDGDSILFVIGLVVFAAAFDLGSLKVDQEGVTIWRVYEPRGRHFAWHQIESVTSTNAMRTILVLPKSGRCRRVNLSLIGFSPKRDIALIIESWMLMYEHHYCGKCGYSLRGNRTGTCPECGTPIPESRKPPVV